MPRLMLVAEPSVGLDGAKPHLDSFLGIFLKLSFQR